jgi:hypothetical protein
VSREPDEGPPPVLTPGWPPPPVHDTGPRPRPPWALPLLLIGFTCSIVVAWISADYAIGQAQGDAPSISMAYAFQMAPFLLAGVPLMLAGALGTARPWMHGRPWLGLVVIGGVLAWFLLVIQGPVSLISG